MRLARRLTHLTRRNLRNACAWVADLPARFDTAVCHFANLTDEDDRP
jgi:hypothetical protein